MSGLDPRTDATAARTHGSKDAAYNNDDVAEWRARLADFYALASDNRPEWRRRVARLSIWMLAGAVSLLANAEIFMLLMHRDLRDTNVGPADPEVVLIDLPAAESVPAQPTRPDTTAATTPHETAIDAAHAPPTPETASRDPDGPAPSDAVTAPDTADPAEVPLVTPAPKTSNAAPLPVPRPRSTRRTAVSRRAVERPVSTRSMKDVPSPSAHAAAARMAATSAFAGASSAADWKSQVVAALNRAKRYPDGTDAAGSPTIRMMVAASGDVSRVAIVASSGSSVLDSAAIETVRRTSPLPPPPGGPMGLTFRMNFHLRSP